MNLRIKNQQKLLAFLFIIFSHHSWALPKHERTMIPFPDNLSSRDAVSMKAMLSLELYQDYDDPNQYYYVPPFRVHQFNEGATSLFMHSEKVKHFGEAHTALALRDGYSDKRILELREEVRINEEKFTRAQTDLDEALAGGIPESIKNRRWFFELIQERFMRSEEKLKEAEDQVAQGKSLLPAGLSQSYFERALRFIGMAGLPLPYAGGEDPELLVPKLMAAMSEVGNSYGGFLTINAYGGFTREQLDALRIFKTKVAPHIKISLLPLDNLTFSPLTETTLNVHTKGSVTSKIFGLVQGSGDYLGATINLDATVAGAVGFSSHLSPFILPVSIKATLKRRGTPTHAKVKCDFKNGFAVKGKREVKPHFIVFGSDIINDISAGDAHKGFCQLHMIRGDTASAAYKSVEAIEQQLTKTFVTRVNLTQAEKEIYFKKVIEEAQKNPQSAGTYVGKIAGKLIVAGLYAAALEALMSAPDTFWQTTENNISNISVVNFSHEILIEPDEVIPKDLPASLCLVYNSNYHAYDRCTELEERQAKGMSEAVEDAAKSCINVTNSIDCGTNRDKASVTAGNRSFVPNSDRTLPATI